MTAMPTNGRYGWYRDAQGVERQRMSSLLKHVETDRWALDNWERRQVLVGAASRDDLIVGAKAIGRPGLDGFTKDQKKSLDELAKKAAEAAKDVDGGVLGTALHTATERIDRGEPLSAVQLPYPYSASLAAYEAMRRLNGWQSVEIERTVDLGDLDVRGTFDRIDVVPGLAALLGANVCQFGHEHGDDHDERELPVIVDVKTEERPWLNGIHIGPQLAGYSRARRMYLPEVDGGTYVDAPCVRQDVGIVVHVRDGDSVPYFINLAEGWDALLAAVEQRERVKRAKRALGTAGCWFAPVPGVKRQVAADIVAASVARSVLDDPKPITDTRLLPTPAAQAFTQPATVAIDDLKPGLISQVWAADTTAELAALWRQVTEAYGVSVWGGALAMAGEARGRQVTCPQRMMHDPATTSKCACGWVRGVRP